MSERQISKAVIRRLPRYRRYLKELEKKGVEKISSKDLSGLIAVSYTHLFLDVSPTVAMSFLQQAQDANIDVYKRQLYSHCMNGKAGAKVKEQLLEGSFLKRWLMRCV